MSRKSNDSELELTPELNLPGAYELREAVANTGRVPKATTIRQDAVAGLTAAVASVPSAMASGVLAGVNPLYGLYASIVGPIAGAFFASTQLMVITSTSASSLVAGEALGAAAGDQRDGRLFLMVVLAGAISIGLGLLGLGRLARFVSYSVMTGFLAGIAAVLVISQLPTAVGYEVEGSNRLMESFDLLRQLDDVNLVTFGLAALTVVLVLVLRRTRLRAFASLIGTAVPTALVVLLSLDDVKTVKDVGTIPYAIPLPVLPPFGEVMEVLSGALAVAAIALVQGAAVSQSVPNPDGSLSSSSRDFVAQGVANIAAGFFRGLPVGGSLSATALSVSSGANHRWAAMFTGLWMGVIVIGLPALVGQVAMPALAGLLILAGIQIIRPRDVASVWRAGWASRLASFATFVGTLVLPIQTAVGLGVVTSMLLYVNRSATDVTVVQLVARPDGRIEERKPPKRLPNDEVTVLDIYGHIFYAGARTLERLLPLPEEGPGHPVVVVRLRGYTKLGATMEEVLAHYSERLDAANGRLYLTGLSEETRKVVGEMAKLHLSGPVRAYEVTPIVGQSTKRAHSDAEAWLVRRTKER